MRKFICLAIFAVLASCSTSSDVAEQNGPLVKKLVQTDTEGNSTTTIYNYSGNKLLSAVSEENDNKIVYSYSGNLITRISFQNMAGNEYVRTNFTYDSSQRLTHTSVLNLGPQTESYADYVYNPDGTISVINHQWDDFEMQYVVSDGKYFLQDGDIVKLEVYTSGATTSNFGYDGKLNPYANITGFTKLLDRYISTHNNTSEIVTSATGDVLQQTSTVYTYTADNYPSTSVRTGIGSPLTSNYFYE